MKTTTSVKLERDIKLKAQKLARELGLSLSAVINSQLRQFIRDRELVLSEPPRMSTYLEEILGPIESDIKTGKGLSPAIESSKDLEDYFKNL